MLDEQTEQMLKIASTLTAEDLTYIRTTAVASERLAQKPQPTVGSRDAVTAAPTQSAGHARPSQGEYERRRTRESKIATAAVGSPRGRHDWWPIGTELVGRIASHTFAATVVANPQVKSGRSLQITSGPAAGSVCLTPTRAALEATEAYRKDYTLGRSGGVTNGWTFWKPKE